MLDKPELPLSENIQPSDIRKPKPNEFLCMFIGGKATGKTTIALALDGMRSKDGTATVSTRKYPSINRRSFTQLGTTQQNEYAIEILRQTEEPDQNFAIYVPLIDTPGGILDTENLEQYNNHAVISTMSTPQSEAQSIVLQLQYADSLIWMLDIAEMIHLGGPWLLEQSIYTSHNKIVEEVCGVLKALRKTNLPALFSISKIDGQDIVTLEAAYTLNDNLRRLLDKHPRLLKSNLTLRELNQSDKLDQEVKSELSRVHQSALNLFELVSLDPDLLDADLETQVDFNAWCLDQKILELANRVTTIRNKFPLKVEKLGRLKSLRDATSTELQQRIKQHLPQLYETIQQRYTFGSFEYVGVSAIGDGLQFLDRRGANLNRIINFIIKSYYQKKNKRYPGDLF